MATNSHHDIYFVGLPPDSCPQTLNAIVTIIKLWAIETFMNIQGYPTASPSLPMPAEEFIASDLVISL